jgi:predicted small secreted protein
LARWIFWVSKPIVLCYPLRMKLLLILSALALVSCNTSIGIYRDTKQAFHWTKDKIQSSGDGGDYGSY